MAYTTIDNPELYFQTKLYTGNGSTQSITLDGDENMSPNFVWIKSRSNAQENILFDTVRGATNWLQSDNTSAEADQNTSLTSFDSDGFSLADIGEVNANTYTYVAWCWKESADSGMDIVSYTGNGSTRTVSHSLSAVPKVIICKSRGNTDGSTSAARNWAVYHAGIASDAETDVMTLDTNGASSDDNAPWNDTAPTSSVWSMGNDDRTNLSNLTYIAYLFAPKQGYSAMGTYKGNGNTDGPFIFCGFRPAWILLKMIGGTYNWMIYDAKREGYNVDNDHLKANNSDQEGTSDDLDILSNGFKMRTSGVGENSSGEPFIWMAFAEAPFVNSKGVPANAR